MYLLRYRIKVKHRETLLEWIRTLP
jgi:hypothetical protein